LANESSAARDIVLLNAGAALCVSGVADTIDDGVQRAQAVLADGSAAAKLADLITISQSFK